jgi:hypothetical protein
MPAGRRINNIGIPRDFSSGRAVCATPQIPVGRIFADPITPIKNAQVKIGAKTFSQNLIAVNRMGVFVAYMFRFLLPAEWSTRMFVSQARGYRNGQRHLIPIPDN